MKLYKLVRSELQSTKLLISYVFLQFGILRFCGPTDFASGEWAGVELETPAGKNDGSVGGVYYFQCLPKHGKMTWIMIMIQYIESEQMQWTIPKADTLRDLPPPPPPPPTKMS